MKSSVETIDPTRVKLSIDAPFAELKPSVDEAYRELAKQVNIPGFRRGKAPARIIDQRVGRPAVIQEAVNNSLDGFYQEALAENDLTPLGQPEVEVTDIPGLDGKDEGDLKVTIEVDVAPTIELPAFDSIEPPGRRGPRWRCGGRRSAWSSRRAPHGDGRSRSPPSWCPGRQRIIQQQHGGLGRDGAGQRLALGPLHRGQARRAAAG